MCETVPNQRDQIGQLLKWYEPTPIIIYKRFCPIWIALINKDIFKNSNEEVKLEVAERIPSRKEVPASSPNSSEAFLASAAPEEDSLLSTSTQLRLEFQKFMEQMAENSRNMEINTEKYQEITNRSKNTT